MVRYAYIAVIAATLTVLARRRIGNQFPCFCVYLAVCLAASIGYAWRFSPQSSDWWFWHWLIWQPLLMLTLAAAVAELAWWTFLRIYPQEARLLLGLIGSLSVMIAFLIYRSLPIVSTVAIVAEVRRYFDTALAVSLLAACGWFWIRPPELLGNTQRHGLILTAFVSVNAAAELTEKANGGVWRAWDGLAYALSILCLLAWMFAMRPASHRHPA